MVITSSKTSADGMGSTSPQGIPAFHVAAGNPARVLRNIETAMMDTDSSTVVAGPGPGPGVEAIVSPETSATP